MKKLTHDELANNLAIHLINDNRMVWEDIPVGKAGSIRPDVLTIEKSYSNPNPISYEIKVSVSDFRSDITKAKWRGYLDFSYGVVFCVPKGLITKNDIPSGCGLMTFNGEFWNTVKKPTLHPAVLNDELLLKLLISGNERQTAVKPIQNRDFNEHKHNETLRKKFGEKLRHQLYFIGEYPKLKKEIRAMKRDLLKILNIDCDVDSWQAANHNIQRSIDKIREAADETLMKAAIAKDLERLSNQVKMDIDRLVKNYTS